MDKKQRLPNGYIDIKAYGTLFHKAIADAINGRSESVSQKTALAGEVIKSRIPSESPLIEDVQFEEV
jgi:hypothetical protein